MERTALLCNSRLTIACVSCVLNYLFDGTDGCSSAENSETQEKVAIKKVSKAFEDLVDAKRILREIKLLQHFDHENVITIVDLLPPISIEFFEDVYIISDLMETDLHRIIYSRQPLSDDHVQYFLYQVLYNVMCSQLNDATAFVTM